MGGSSADRTALEHRLASLLGFDDAVEDIFEQLLSIDSSEDLFEYLSSLLGDDGDSVKQFVQDVERFQKDEALIHSTKATTYNTTLLQDNSNEESKKKVIDAAAEQRARVAAAEKEKKQRQEDERQKRKLEQQQQQQKEKAKSKNKREEMLKKKKENQANKKAGGNKKTSLPKSNDTASAVKQTTNNNVKKALEKPTPPQRGKAKFTCGCFGTRHKPLTNCLHCGRIACEKEGYGYCPFCGYLIEQLDIQMGENKKLDKALIHKERLLKFDREFTQRTVILDDQADYFSNTTSAWLNEEEQYEAEERDAKKRQEMHERKKLTLDIAF